MKRIYRYTGKHNCFFRYNTVYSITVNYTNFTCTYKGKYFQYFPYNWEFTSRDQIKIK